MPITKASRYAWFNGEITPRENGAPSVASISFHLGTGVFDGMMAYRNGSNYYIHRGKEHLVRLRQGAARMGLVVPWTVEDMFTGICELLAQEPAGTQYVRPIAYRRTPELWVTGGKDRPVDVCIFTVQVERDIDDLITCEVSTVERISSKAIPGQTKVSGAYVNSYNARMRAEAAGFHDGIMLDREGRLAEASAANLFLISKTELLTPALMPDVFPGITRQVILELAAEVGITAHERELRPSDLAAIDGAFLCSTLMEIRGISRIGQQSLATERSQIYMQLVSAFRALTHQR